jgi:hypothetical protein
MYVSFDFEGGWYLVLNQTHSAHERITPLVPHAINRTLVRLFQRCLVL